MKQINLQSALTAQHTPLTLLAVLPSLSDQISADLLALRSSNRFRSCPALSGNSRVNVTLDGQPLISFCSNDYLGLSTNPHILSAATKSAFSTGFGAGASRLVAGNLPAHIALENDLAQLLGFPAALLFPTGYQANLGVITAFAGQEDLIVADRSVHASIIDACRLSRAKLAFYPHLDAATADKHLRRLGPSRRRRFLVTESLFSMDGDIAPLPDLASAASANDAALIVDEAHALGCLGPSGRGLCAKYGVKPDVIVGTLGKAFGASGAFAAGTKNLRDYLLNRARTFIFSTALPIPVAAATQAAVAIALSPQGESLRAHLANLSISLRASLGLPPTLVASPIVPLVLGTDQAALEVSHQLLAKGFFVQAIRPPTVREGTSRLRITLSALHTQQQVADLATAINSLHLPTFSTGYSDRTEDPNSEATALQAPKSSSSAPSSVPHLASHSPLTLPTPPSQGIVLLGTDTGVGKTTIAVALLHLLARRGAKPVPFKPIETGADPLPLDAGRLRYASGREDIPLNIVCPLSFPNPVAAAAATADHPLTLLDLLSHIHTAASYGTPLVVETAGGLLSPYAHHFTPADLAAALGYPVLLIARNGLGTINHTALAVAEITRRALPLLGIVLVTTTPTATPDQPTNLSLIADTTGLTPLGVLPFVKTQTPSSLADSLEATVDLRPILDGLAR